MKPAVVGVVGWKNSGKTTLVTRLVREFTARGLRVSVVKHAHHSFEIDHLGRDSYRAREAGASEVAVVSPARWAIIHELRSEAEPSLEEVLTHISPCDLVIVEGYKKAPIPKVEVRSAKACLHHPLAPDDPHIVAIASDAPESHAVIPHFHRDEITPLAEFLLENILHCADVSHRKV